MFVIAGDQNADPLDGDSIDSAILNLLENPLVNSGMVPASDGGVEAAMVQGGANADHEGDAAHDPADFSETSPGNLRVDYVLPSAGLDIVGSGVFWPNTDDPLLS